MNYTNYSRAQTIDRLEIVIESLKRLHILMRESDGKDKALREEWEQLMDWIPQL